MSRRTEKRKYGKYNKFDVVYADFGKNPHGCYRFHELSLN